MLKFQKVKELNSDNIKETICYVDSLISKGIKMNYEDFVAIIAEAADLFRSEGVIYSRKDSAYLAYSKPDERKNHLDKLDVEPTGTLEVPDFIKFIKMRSI